MAGCRASFAPPHAFTHANTGDGSGAGAVLLALGDQMQVRKLALCPCVVAWFDSVMGVSHLRASALVADERGEGGICGGGSCQCRCVLESVFMPAPVCVPICVYVCVDMHEHMNIRIFMH